MADTDVTDARRGPGRPPAQTVERPAPPLVVSAKDRERLAELAAKDPNPNVLPASTRTEDEEGEYRALSAAVAEADRQAAVVQVEVKLDPAARLQQIKAKGGQNLGEGETIEVGRLEELLADEKRARELEAMDKRTDEEAAELAMVRERAAEARAAGGYAA
jgi:hypothetical protein